MNRQETEYGKLVLMAAAAVVGLWLLYLARWGVVFVYISLLLAVGVSPLVQWIVDRPLFGTRRHLPRWAAALAVYLLGIGIVAGIASAVLPPLIAQSRELVENLPTLMQETEGFLIQHNVLSERVRMNDVQQIPGGGTVIKTVLSGFGSAIGALFAAVLVVVLSFYLVNEAGGPFRGVIVFVPPRHRREVREVVAEMTDKIGAWMIGQLMLSVIVGAITVVVLGILGVPYFIVLSLVAAIGEFVPYAGPVIAAVPAVALAYTISWELAVGVLIFYVALQRLENDILVPKLMQHQVGLSPASVLIAITIGSMLLGVLGAILAVPTAAIVQVVLGSLRPDE